MVKMVILKFLKDLYKALYVLIARGIKELRWRFVFSGGSLSLQWTLPRPKSASCRG